jgi:hypothetical protein
MTKHIISSQFFKNHATRVLQTCLQAALTLSERYLEKTQNVPERLPRHRGSLELSSFSPGFFQGEIMELEGRFAKLELHASDTIETVIFDRSGYYHRVVETRLQAPVTPSE